MMGWNYGYGYPMGYGAYGVTHIIFSVFSAVFFIALAVFAVKMIRNRHTPGHRGCCGSDTALDILKERYAKGEIDRTEFEEKKKDLS